MLWWLSSIRIPKSNGSQAIKRWLRSVRIIRKGKKTRSIPLMEKTVQHLEKYLSEFHSGLPISSEEPLFYSTMHGERHKLTARNMRYVLRAYGEKAGLECPEVPEKIFPHLLRHNRAMHLYQEGMDLTLVSQ